MSPNNAATANTNEESSDVHRSGQGTIECRYCGSELTIRCAGVTGSFDSAWCSECALQWTRRREPEADNDQEYHCEQCSDTHRYTVPVEPFTHQEQELVVENNELILNCACGHQTVLSQQLSANELMKCSQCTRIYAFLTSDIADGNGK